MNIHKRNYEEDAMRLRQFLESHYTHDPDTGKKVFKYSDMVRDVANREAVTVEIDLEEVAEFDEDLARAIRTNTIRYQRLLSSTLDELIPKYRSVQNSPVKDILGSNFPAVASIYLFFQILTLSTDCCSKPDNTRTRPPATLVRPISDFLLNSCEDSKSASSSPSPDTQL